MRWWLAAYSSFGAWIFALATSHTAGGLAHLFLIAGIAIVLARTLGGGASAALNPRRRRRARASRRGKTPSGRA